MYAFLALGGVSLILCLILTPIIRDIFLKLEIVDMPDDKRKLHSKPIPRIGGIPIVLSYAGALLILSLMSPDGATIVIKHQDLLWRLLPAAAVVFLTGLVNDIVGLKPWQKLAGQTVGAVWAVAMGAHITLITGQPIADYLSYPLSVIWLVGCTNAFNLIDGLDGLASGVGLFATLTTLFTALIQGDMGLAMATIPLVGCLLGFLRYNFNPASVFLGDSGSLTIGFFLGCFGLIWSQKSATLLGMVAPLMAMALPLIDVGLAIGRRFLRNQPIFQPDRGHIHHRLLALGFKTRDVALILYAVCGIAAVLSLLQSMTAFKFGGLFIVLFCSLSWFGIHRLGYVEFRAARQMFTSGGFLRVLQEEIYLRHLHNSLEHVLSLDDAWKILCEASRDLHFESISLEMPDRRLEQVFEEGSKHPWTFQLSLAGIGDLRLTRDPHAKSPAFILNFIRVVQETLESVRPNLTGEYALAPEVVMMSHGQRTTGVIRRGDTLASPIAAEARLAVK